MTLPTKEEFHQCYSEFYDRTSGKNFTSSVCPVCARLVYAYEDPSAKSIPIEEVPNRDRLKPQQHDNPHDLTDGMLLDKAGLTHVNTKTLVFVCSECRSDLVRYNDPKRPPRFSLANDLWIGPMPMDLRNLTLPEQLLISQVFTRVYIVKLYPRKGYGGDPSTLQNALRGRDVRFRLRQGRMATHHQVSVAACSSPQD